MPGVFLWAWDATNGKWVEVAVNASGILQVYDPKTETELAKKVNKATTPTKYALTITNADTEYSQALPANTKQFSVHLRDMSAFRIAYETGKVATPTDLYETVPAGSEKYIENIEPSSLTLYIAAPAGTKVAEIEAWA